jgi:DnaJ-class molecular chaperone
LIAVGAAATDSLVEDYTDYAADNFYQILGVPENASRRDIKRAYKAMMKDFHPDLSGDEESTEFCILLNDIYEVCRGQGSIAHILVGHRLLDV